MDFISALTAVIANGLLVVLGLTGNFFIIICNLFFRSSGEKLHMGDMLVSCIAVSTVVLDVSLYLSMVLFLLGGMCPNSNLTMQISTFFIIVALSLNSWLITLLCVYYCVMIVNLNNRVFLRLQQNISTVICCCLAGTLPIIFLLGSFPFSAAVVNHSGNSTTQNNSCPPTETMSNDLGQVTVPLFIMQNIVTLVLMMSSCCTIVVFLYGHIRQMQLNSPDISGSSQENIIRLAKKIMVLALLYLTCTIYGTLPAIIQEMKYNKEYVLVLSLMCSVTCLGVSATLIAVNSNLRQKALSCMNGLRGLSDPSVFSTNL